MAHRKGASRLLVNLCVHCSLVGPYRTVDAEAAPMRAKAAMRKNRILREGLVCWCIEKIVLKMSWWVVVWLYVFFTGDIRSIYNFGSRDPRPPRAQASIRVSRTPGVFRLNIAAQLIHLMTDRPAFACFRSNYVSLNVSKTTKMWYGQYRETEFNRGNAVYF